MKTKLRQMRLNKGVTQEQLAGILGISKGAVSKWETGTSLPDIMMLPSLADYYECSIDDFFEETSISPQKIKESYIDWGNSFNKEGFYDSFVKLKEVSAHYLNNPKMLLSNVLVTINHLQIEHDQAVIFEAVEWCKSILTIVLDKATNASDISKATMLKATCHLFQGETERVISEFENDDHFLFISEPLLVQALVMTGKLEEAKSILQKISYQFLLNLIASLEQLAKNEDDFQRFSKLISLRSKLIELFEVQHFHPGCLVTSYLNIAAKYLTFNEREGALRELTALVSLLENVSYPFKLEGNDVFNLIEDWLTELSDSNEMPVNSQVLANQLVTLFKSKPFKDYLETDLNYQELEYRLEKWRDGYVNG